MIAGCTQKQPGDETCAHCARLARETVNATGELFVAGSFYGTCGVCGKPMPAGALVRHTPAGYIHAEHR